jgi:hypothetical protein
LYNLTVPALLELNVSSIQCIAFCNESAAITSDVSYLMIQGLLSNVKNPQIIQINSSTLSLSYQPPSTLQGVPILCYTIDIKGQYSINTTSLKYHVHFADKCQPHSLSITPWNAVGMGNTTVISNIIMYNGNAITVPCMDTLLLLIYSSSYSINRDNRCILQ